MYKPITAERPIGQLLPEFHKQYGLGENGGIAETKVKIVFAKYLFFFFPNWNERRRAVEKHDIHHIITGYQSIIKGESEISVWEVSSGCNTYWAAWFLDMQGMVMGILFLPAIFRAFVRGQRSKNLYHNTISNAEAIKLTPAELRKQLGISGLNEKLKPTTSDYFLFVWWMGLAGLVSLLSLLALPVIIFYNLYVFAGMVFAPKKNALN